MWYVNYISTKALLFCSPIPPKQITAIGITKGFLSMEQCFLYELIEDTWFLLLTIIVALSTVLL
jgi:hypothetical protein